MVECSDAVIVLGIAIFLFEEIRDLLRNVILWLPL